MKQLFLTLLILAAPAMAVDTTTEDEKRYLIKISQDIAHISELANKAKQSADPDARVSLDYVALINDLNEIKRALDAHINAPSRSPRKIQSLQLSVGEYQ
jgi:RAQPRD family integrative conjugative element protein